MAKVIEASDPHAAWATMDGRSLVNILLSGLIVGAVTYAAYLLLERFVFEPILCRESVALARCETKEHFASGVAIVIGSMLGLILLVRERVYRPILALIGVAVGLWSIFTVVAALPWIAALIVTVLAFGVAYMLFSWLVQPTSLVLCIALVILAAALVRLGLTL
ncbi:MAG TPA: hypothetical protein PK096_03725 [Candidatus Saccharibacteria bacterium]|nr:hypothetical protein [Candidatus Saccharibacteria bacterium]HRK94452.1 hypothetical protein [Candidatus Saccharibacteria bacterium]